MGQQTKINQGNILHQQNIGKEKQNHLNDGIKEFDRVQHLFMTKALSKTEIEVNFYTTIKAIHEKPTTNTTVVKDRKLALPRTRNNAHFCHFQSTLYEKFQPEHAGKNKKEKRHLNQKGRSNTIPIHSCHNLVSQKAPKITYTKLELKFSKVLWFYFKLSDDTVVFVFSLLLVIRLLLYWYLLQLTVVEKF